MPATRDVEARSNSLLGTLSSSLVVGLLAVCGTLAHAGAGPLGIDREWSYDDHGIWASKYERGLELGVLVFEAGGALWLGDDAGGDGDEAGFGHTLWQSLDASAVSGIAGQIMKYAFSRARPNQGNDPGKWFQGSCCDSFPSGQVTLQASFVTPIILDYARREPWVWALEILPAYDAAARLKHHEHWQTDVIAGWALGSAAGYWAAKRETPVLVQILPRGLTVGFYKRF